MKKVQIIRKPSFRQEKLLWKKGFKNVIGLDEVGKGSFAGPVVAAAVILPHNFKASGVKDSKLLSAKKRGLLSEYILENSLEYSIATVSVNYINKYGVEKATSKAFLICLGKLKTKFDFVLVDGYKIKNLKHPQMGIIHGDSKCVSIAAASIIAKVYRDNLMIKLDKQYLEYNFAKNKGYGTREHREAIKKHGLSMVHRTSFNLSKYLL